MEIKDYHEKNPLQRACSRKTTRILNLLIEARENYYLGENPDENKGMQVHFFDKDTNISIRDGRIKASQKPQSVIIATDAVKVDNRLLCPARNAWSKEDAKTLFRVNQDKPPITNDDSPFIGTDIVMNKIDATTGKRANPRTLPINDSHEEKY